jgi:hypothetical protein
MWQYIPEGSNHHYVGFEVPTAVVMKSSIFWDTTLCSPLEVSTDISEKHITSISRVED